MKRFKIAALVLIVTFAVGACAPASVGRDDLGAPSDPAGPGVLSLSAAGGVTDTPAQITDKTESVYARADAYGTLREAYVVNRFSVARAGRVTDYGAYAETVNLSDLGTLTRDGGQVSFDAPAGAFFYQGTLEAPALPWRYELSYVLDGQTVTPEELTGRNGALELRIRVRADGGADPVFAEHYMQQISVTLDSQKCRDIAAPSAVLASAGKDVLAVFTVLPGQDADLTVTAQVTDFTMTGVECTAMPYSMDFTMPDTSEMLEDFNLLTDALAQLDDGTAKLADGTAGLSGGADELTAGAAELSDGANGLSAGAQELRDGADGLSAGAQDLRDGSAQFRDGLSQLAQAASYVAAMEIDDPVAAAAVQQLTARMRELEQGYAAFDEGLQQYTSGVAQYAAGTRTFAAGAQTYASGAAAFTSGLSEFSAGVAELGGGVSELRAGTKELREQTADLPARIQTEIDGLTDDYAPAPFTPVSFVSDQNQGVSAVQFVVKTAPVEKPEPPAEPAPDDEALTFWQRLIRLFTR